MTGSLVIDASVSAAWCFEDETTEETEAALELVMRDGGRAPSLWLFEMANVLALAERRGRMGRDQTESFASMLLALPIELDRLTTGRMTSLMRLARAQGSTAYDAAYLELAVRTGSALATRDGALRRVAHRLGIPLLDARHETGRAGEDAAMRL